MDTCKQFVLPISFEPPKDFKVTEYFYGFLRQKTELKAVKHEEALYCFINDNLISLDQLLNYQKFVVRSTTVTKYSKEIEDELWEIEYFYFSREKVDYPYFILATGYSNSPLKHAPFKNFLLEIPESEYDNYTKYELSDVNKTLYKLKGLYNVA